MLCQRLQKKSKHKDTISRLSWPLPSLQLPPLLQEFLWWQDQQDQQHRLHHLELTTGCCIKISTWRPLSTMSCAGPSFWAAACRRGWSVFVVFLMHPHIPHDKLPWAVHGCSILGWIFKLLLWIENLWAGWSKTGCYSHHVRHENARPTPKTRSLRVLITCFFSQCLDCDRNHLQALRTQTPWVSEPFRKRFGTWMLPARTCKSLLSAAARSCRSCAAWAALATWRCSMVSTHGVQIVPTRKRWQSTSPSGDNPSIKHIKKA